MGESACLVRSLSQPAEIYSRTTDEGDPGRVLTESVSFGRFMSESLAWEKWSTFSHNRYLEEVEKFAKPGSVAQKKAFFEAHYKKRAAMKATQKKLEESNVAPHDIPGDEDAVESQKDNPIDSQVPVMVTTGMVHDKVRQGEICHTEEGPVVDENSCNSISQMQVKTDVETSVAKDCSPENIEHLKIAESHVEVAGFEDKVLKEGNPTSLRKEKRESSSGSKASGGRLRSTPSCGRGFDSSHDRTEQDGTSSGKKSTSVTKKQKRSTLDSNKELLQTPHRSPRSSIGAKAVEATEKKRTVSSSVHTDINLPSSRYQMEKTEQKFPIRCSTMQTSTSFDAKNTPRNSTRTKGTGEADKKKRSVPGSIHMSINFAASPRKRNSIRSSTRQEAASSKSKSSPSGAAATRQEGMSSKARNIPRSGKAVGEADKKKVSAPSAVHMLNFAASHQKRKAGQRILIRSSTQEANSSKDENNAFPRERRAWMGASGSQKRPHMCSSQTTINHGSHVSGTTKTSPKTIQDDLSTAKCSAKASVVRLPRLPLKNQIAEDIRENTIVGSSNSVRIPKNEKNQSCGDQCKLSIPTKARSCTVSSPFSFQSDERAQKRKEFFKLLEEKNKNEVAHRLHSDSKIPPTKMISQRQCRNRSLCLNNEGKSHRPPQKISSVITKKTENVAGEKQRNNKIHPPTSTTSLLKRKTQENISPNIQQ